jgi:hypothetical protein
VDIAERRKWATDNRASPFSLVSPGLGLHEVSVASLGKILRGERTWTNYLEVRDGVRRQKAKTRKKGENFAKENRGKTAHK